MTMVWLHKLGSQFRAGKYGTDLVFTTLHRLLAPYSRREDEARREYIFNVIALTHLVVTGVMFVTVIYLELIKSVRNGISVWLSAAIVLTFLGLFALGKTRYRRLARQIFLIVLLAPCIYALLQWGLLLVMPLLGCALIIVMAGILHSSRTALVYTTAIATSLGLIHWSHVSGLVVPNQLWITDPIHSTYWIEMSSVLLAILVVTWLAEREINAGQIRAHFAEETLRQERDQLELRLEERTNQLARIHSEQTANLLKMAHYGHEFAGYFHDLINPITAVSISLERANQNPSTPRDPLLDKAESAMHTVINFVHSVQKQLQKEAKPELINLFQAVTQATEIVQHKLRRQNIVLHTDVSATDRFVMDPIKLFQVISNLLNNAAEACGDCPPARPRQIWLSTRTTDYGLLITVTDTGSGIPTDIQSHIFEPLTTSKNAHNTGLGLSIVQHIVTQEYGGSIEVTKTGPDGTTFSVHIPKR